MIKDEKTLYPRNLYSLKTTPLEAHGATERGLHEGVLLGETLRVGGNLQCTIIGSLASVTGV